MTAEPLNSTSEDADLGIRAILEHISEAFANVVIDHAIESFKQCPADTRNEFESLIRGSDATIPGFRLNVPGSPLPPPGDPRLRRIVGERAITSDQDCGVLLRTWADSQPELHGAVVTHLSGLGIEAAYPDFNEERFRGMWADRGWVRERDVLSKRIPEHSPEDVALMICYVTGLLPDVDLDTDSETESAQEYPNLNPVLSRIRELEVGDREWEQALEFIDRAEEFAAAARDVSNKTAAEAARDRERVLNKTISDLRLDYGDELEYLDIELNPWQPQDLSATDIVITAQDLMNDLRVKLEYYRPIRPQAHTRISERERADERLEHETGILATLDRWNMILEEVTGQPEDVTDVAGQSETHSEGEGLGDRSSNGTTSASELTEVDTVKTERAESTIARQRAEILSLQTKLSELSDRFNRGVRDKRNITVRSNKALLEGRRPFLYQSPAAHDPPTGGMRFDSVSAAVEAARRELTDHLEIRLNSHSRVDDNPFEKADEVWGALHWLATIYHGTKSGKERVVDLSHSIQEAVGWTYASHQSKTTMSQNPEAYTTTLDGAEYTLGPHLRTGSNRDARYTMRIGFAWDKDLVKVIVGYIGPHQPTQRD